MRRSHLGTTVVPMFVVMVMLAGCGGREAGAGPSASAGPDASSSASQPGTPRDPQALIGSWTLADVGDDRGAKVVFESGTLSIRRDCGTFTGSWLADTGGLFVAYVYAASGCRLPAEATPGWLREATSFDTDGDARVLLDARGGRVARLLPDGAGARPSASQTAPPSRSSATPGDPTATRTPAAAPKNLAPADRAALVGRWKPTADHDAAKAYLQLGADGGWSASDGCNVGGGRWVAGQDGTVLAVAGASTMMFCPGASVGSWFSQARRVGVDDGTLVLVDVDGKEIGRLVRDR